LELSPSKIKAGWGEGTCLILFKLASITIQNKFRFKKPIIKSEGNDMDEDADDNDDLDGGQDMADEIHAEPDSGSDIDEELDYGGGTNVHAELARQMEAEM